MSMPLGLAEHIAGGERSQDFLENTQCAYKYINERLKEIQARKADLEDDEILFLTHKRQLEKEFRQRFGVERQL